MDCGMSEKPSNPRCLDCPDYKDCETYSMFTDDISLCPDFKSRPMMVADLARPSLELEREDPTEDYEWSQKRELYYLKKGVTFRSSVPGEVYYFGHINYD